MTSITCPVIFHPFKSRVDLQPFKCDISTPTHIRLSESVDKLVIGTYNVLFPQKFDKDQFSSNAGYNVTADMAVIPNHTWRIQIKIKNILNAKPNSFALQEVTQDEFDEYQNTLKDYKGLFCLHPRGIHGVAIFYKSDEFNLIGAEKGTFEFDVPISYSKTITKRRIHLIADLQDKSGMVLRMVSCHLFDPRDFVGKIKSKHLEAVIDHANIFFKDSIDMLVICGDMNQDQFGDDVTAYSREDSKPVDLTSITAFAPIKEFIYDGDLSPTLYDKDLSRIDGEMLSTKRKTDWIFIQTKNNIKVEKLKGVVLKSVKISSEYPSLQKKEHDLRGSDHALTLTKIQIKRTFF